MAYTDPLTQTNNRASFNASVKREMSLAVRHTKSLSIIFLDIDHFKAINDHHGHECGDITLTAQLNGSRKVCAVVVAAR
jgi:diguanylate cyclase (GGDEF)-like protein